MMARTVASTSGDDLALGGQEGGEALLEIRVADCVKRDGHAKSAQSLVHGAGRRPAQAAPSVGQPRLDALDLEPDRGRRRQSSSSIAPAGCVGRQRSVMASSVSTSSVLRAGNAVQLAPTARGRNAASTGAARYCGRKKPAFVSQAKRFIASAKRLVGSLEFDVADLHHGVLDMGRDDFQVLVRRGRLA